VEDNGGMQEETRKEGGREGERADGEQLAENQLTEQIKGRGRNVRKGVR